MLETAIIAPLISDHDAGFEKWETMEAVSQSRSVKAFARNVVLEKLPHSSDIL